MTWIIAAIVTPVPIIHFWLHALLPWWRKRPQFFRLWVVILLAGSLYIFPKIDKISPILFRPSAIIQFLGYGLIGLGAAAIFSSIITLTPKRFFMWAVLTPEKHEQRLVTGGPFKFVPHPAYLGYILAALGNLLVGGKFYLAGVLLFLVTLMPLVIYLEEREMNERLKTTK